MRVLAIVSLLAWSALPGGAADNQERGKRVVNEALAALGGDNFLAMRDRVESGRVYSFYRERLSGLSVATIYTRYLTRPEPPTPAFLGVRERQAFGKKQNYAILFTEDAGYDITFRGARPLQDELIQRYRSSTLHNILYILRMRLGEPGLVMESRGSDILENQPVEVVDITDGENRTVTVYFHQSSKLPIRQVYFRRDLKTRERDEEVTIFSKFRDVGGGVMWPFTLMRERNGEKIFQIYADSVAINRDLQDDLFTLPSDMKILKKQK